MNNLFYVYKGGYIVSTSEMRTAFYITHGEWPKDEVELDKWVSSLKNILEVISEKAMPVERLAAIRETQAVKLYRDRTGCTIKEAKDHIDRILGKKKMPSKIEDFVHRCHFKPMDDLAKECLMPMDEFIEDIRSGCITNYDGTGELVLDNSVVDNAVVYPNEGLIRIHSKPTPSFFSLDEVKELFGDRAQIAWYNK